MTKQYSYNPDEGEFIDFSTLEDWETRDKAKDEKIKQLEAEVEKLKNEIKLELFTSRLMQYRLELIKHGDIKCQPLK